MRMMEQGSFEAKDVGTPEYYREFIGYTEDIYKLMKGLKAKLSAGDAPAPAAEEKPESKPEPVPAESDDLSDLF